MIQPPRPLLPLKGPVLTPEDWFLLILMIVCLLFCTIKSCKAQDDPHLKRNRIASFWINDIYTKRWNGYKALSKDQAELYAWTIDQYCVVYDLNFDRELARLAHESKFVNGIRDMNLIPRKWAFGICNIWYSEAKEEALILGITRNFTAHDLILDPKLNIQLGLGEMARLIVHYDGDYRKAEIEFNAGRKGARMGRGKKYPYLIDEAEADWIKFLKTHGG